MKGHMNAVSRIYPRGVTDNRRAVVVPADRVSAAEHRERAEALETCGTAAQPRVRRMQPLCGGRRQAAVHRGESGPYTSEPPPQIECFELQPERVVRALAGRERSTQASSQFVRQLRGMTGAQCDPPAITAETGPRLERSDAQLEALNAAVCGGGQPVREPIERGTEIIFPRDDQFRGS